MRKTAIVCVVLGVALCLAAPATAQLKLGKDYETSEAIFNVTNVKVKPNMLGFYLQGLKQTWVTSQEVAKEMGHIRDCALYWSETPDGGDYNLTLVVTYENLAQYEKARKEFAAFDEAVNKRISDQKSQELTATYPDMREIVDEQLNRRITFK